MSCECYRAAQQRRQQQILTWKCVSMATLIALGGTHIRLIIRPPAYWGGMIINLLNF